MLEELANLCHSQWSGWMDYLFQKGQMNDDGSFTIYAPYVERWHRQMVTPYEDLSNSERDSDRVEAKKFLRLFNGDISDEDRIEYIEKHPAMAQDCSGSQCRYSTNASEGPWFDSVRQAVDYEILRIRRVSRVRIDDKQQKPILHPEVVSASIAMAVMQKVIDNGGEIEIPSLGIVVASPLRKSVTGENTGGVVQAA
jgi:hypothetical protein